MIISFSIDHIVLNIQQSLCIIQPNPRRQLNPDVVQVDESSALVMISSAIMTNFFNRAVVLVTDELNDIRQVMVTLTVTKS